MAKFVKVEMVEATQWRRMGDHPDVCVDRLSAGYFIDTGIGMVDVIAGDWIVKYSFGRIVVMSPDVFKESCIPFPVDAEGNGDWADKPFSMHATLHRVKAGNA